MRRALVLLCATAVLGYNLPQIAPRCRSRAPLSEIVMGRKFENNKLKMAKTALAYAKKASYIGKKVVVAVKASGDDPAVNRQLAAVMAEANARLIAGQQAAEPRQTAGRAAGHRGIGSAQKAELEAARGTIVHLCPPPLSVVVSGI